MSSATLQVSYLTQIVVHIVLIRAPGTLEGLAGMLDRTGELAAGKVIIPDDAGEGGVTRIWIAHGDKDGITAFAASKRLADALNVKDKEFKAYKGHYHRCKWNHSRNAGMSLITLAVHDEPSPDKEVFMDDVANWILARSVEPVQVDGARPKL
jgi:acylglycerol lipase